MEKKNNKTKIYLIMFISFALVVLAASAYAFYVNDITFGDELPLNTQTAQQSVFTSKVEGDLSFKGTPKDIGQYSVSTTPILTDSATLTVDLSGTSDYETTMCTYDIVWNYSSSDMYTESDVELPYTTSKGTYPYELSVKINDEREIDLSDFIWEDGRAVIMDDVVIASASTDKTTQVYDIVVNMYNIDAEQVNLFDKTFAANIEVVSSGCTTKKFEEGKVHAYAFERTTNKYYTVESVPAGTISASKTTCVKGAAYSGIAVTGDECFAVYEVERYFVPVNANTLALDIGNNVSEAIASKGTNNLMSSDNSWGIIHETFVDETTGETVDTGYRYEGSDYVTPTGGNATDIVSCTRYASCTFTGDTTSSTYTSYREAAEAAVAQGKLKYSGIQNYVCFEEGCEDKDKYRIIGTFNVTYDANKDGSATDTGNLTKIIKDELIKKEDGSVLKMAFEADNVGYYIGSDMESYLNNTYASSLPSKVKNMVMPATYYLGNVTFNKTAPEQYAEERGSTVHTDRLASTVTTYGLIYPSDYGYAVLASDCARTTPAFTGYVSACSQENWMYNYGLNGQKSSWRNISPDAYNAAYVFHVSDDGSVSTGASVVVYAVRPSWYLNPDTKIIGGLGTKDNPYILGL